MSSVPFVCRPFDPVSSINYLESDVRPMSHFGSTCIQPWIFFASLFIVMGSQSNDRCRLGFDGGFCVANSHWILLYATKQTIHLHTLYIDDIRTLAYRIASLYKYEVWAIARILCLVWNCIRILYRTCYTRWARFHSNNIPFYVCVFDVYVMYNGKHISYILSVWLVHFPSK